MSISDWSSDVCSSDLTAAGHARHVVIGAAGHDQRLFADDAFAFDFAGLAAPVADPPMAADQLHGVVAMILDAHMIGPEPAAERRVRLFGQIADRDAHGDGRSEEHTYELQSLMRISYAVFCLTKNTRTNSQQKSAYRQ